MCKIFGIIIIGAIAFMLLLIAAWFLFWLLSFPVRGFVNGLLYKNERKTKKENLFDREDYIFVPLILGTIVFLFVADIMFGSRDLVLLGPCWFFGYIALFLMSLGACYLSIKLVYCLFFLLGFFINLSISFIKAFAGFLCKSW